MRSHSHQGDASTIRLASLTTEATSSNVRLSGSRSPLCSGVPDQTTALVLCPATLQRALRLDRCDQHHTSHPEPRVILAPSRSRAMQPGWT
jgi:hypothetical protein